MIYREPKHPLSHLFIMQSSALPDNTTVLEWILKEQKKHMDAYLALEKLKQQLLPSSSEKKISSMPLDLHWGC